MQVISCFQCKWKMSLNQMSKMRRRRWPCWRTDVSNTRIWYTESLTLCFCSENWHDSLKSGHKPELNTLAPCCAPPPFWRAAASSWKRRRDGEAAHLQIENSSTGRLWGSREHGGGGFSQQEQFPQPFTLFRISSCSFFLSSSFWDSRSAGGLAEFLPVPLFRILLFWAFHSSAYKLPGVARRVWWLPCSATLPWKHKRGANAQIKIKGPRAQTQSALHRDSASKSPRRLPNNCCVLAKKPQTRGWKRQTLPLPRSHTQTRASPSPTSAERAEVLAVSLAHPGRACDCTLLVILMSTPGSPLLVTLAYTVATSHADVPPRHNPLIPAIWLREHGTRQAVQRSLLSFYPPAQALVENVSSPASLLTLTLTF